MNIFVELSANLYDAVAGVLFVILFCSPKGGKKRYIAPFVLLVFAISTFFTFYSAFSLLHSVLITAVLFAVSFLLTRGNTVKKILAPIIFELVLLTVNTVFLTGFCYFLDLDLEALLTQSSVSRTFLIIFCKIVLALVLVCILKFTDFRSKPNITSLILYLASPTLTAFILYVFMKMSLSFDLNSYAPFIIAGTLGIALMNFTSILLFEISNTNAEAKIKLEMLENQLKTEKESYQRMLSTAEELGRLRHDIKNHLVYVRGIIEDGDSEQAEKYIETVETELSQTEKYMVTGNRTIDYVIASKFSSNPHVTLVCTGHFGDMAGFDPLDIAVLFGNLLDNAIEAVETVKSRIIEVRLSVYNDYYNILISNPIDASVLKANPGLASTKADAHSHGFGIRSAERIVEKYGGIFEIFEERSRFCVQISLPFAEKS